MELKPCPFCGSEAEYMEYEDGAGEVFCETCGVRTGIHGIGEKMIEAWNTRHQPDTVAISRGDLEPIKGLDMALQHHEETIVPCDLSYQVRDSIYLAIIVSAAKKYQTLLEYALEVK